MLPSLTVMEFIPVVSGIRHLVGPVDRPAVGVLFLPEAWSQHIINSGHVTHTCIPVRRRLPWKKRKKKRGEGHRNSCLTWHYPEALAMLSFCLTLQTSLRAWLILPFLRTIANQVVGPDRPTNGEDMWKPPGGLFRPETVPMASAGHCPPAWRIWLSLVHPSVQWGDQFPLLMNQWKSRVCVVRGALGMTRYSATGAEVLLLFVIQGLENIISCCKLMV